MTTTERDLRERVAEECYEHDAKWSPQAPLPYWPEVDESVRDKWRAHADKILALIDTAEPTKAALRESYLEGCRDTVEDLRGPDARYVVVDADGRVRSLKMQVYESALRLAAILVEYEDDDPDQLRILPVGPEPRVEPEEVSRLRSALQVYEDIVAESEGVEGYHLNGTIAYWDEFDLPEPVGRAPSEPPTEAGEPKEAEGGDDG